MADFDNVPVEIFCSQHIRCEEPEKLMRDVRNSKYEEYCCKYLQGFLRLTFSLCYNSFSKSCTKTWGWFGFYPLPAHKLRLFLDGNIRNMRQFFFSRRKSLKGCQPSWAKSCPSYLKSISSKSPRRWKEPSK